MKKVAVIGTVGVPAKYGGFETLVENLIGECCSEDVDYTVFCSGKAYPTRLKTYKNARLEYVPLHANGMQSIPYDIWSLIRTVGRGYDVVLILGVSGCLFLPLYRLLFRKRIVVNIDGNFVYSGKWVENDHVRSGQFHFFTVKNVEIFHAHVIFFVEETLFLDSCHVEKVQIRQRVLEADDFFEILVVPAQDVLADIIGNAELFR